jgi:hypothetical protein
VHVILTCCILRLLATLAITIIVIIIIPVITSRQGLCQAPLTQALFALRL